MEEDARQATAFGIPQRLLAWLHFWLAEFVLGSIVLCVAVTLLTAGLVDQFLAVLFQIPAAAVMIVLTIVGPAHDPLGTWILRRLSR